MSPDMIMKVSKKSWFHILVWLTLSLYLIFAPEFVATVSTQGKPLDTANPIPAESDQISFRVEGVEMFPLEHNLWNLYGWAFLESQKVNPALLVREVVLISEDQIYFFSTEAVARNPSRQSYFVDRGVNLNTLGFNALILQATIETGTYRIGMLFRNESNSIAYYTDKPAYYLVKTPNTMRLERKSE